MECANVYEHLEATPKLAATCFGTCRMAPATVMMFQARACAGGAPGGRRTSESGTLASGLAALAQPFKLRLSRRSGSGPTLRDYSGNVVLIEPLASVGAIEDFLWPRVHRTSADVAEEAAAAERRAQVVLPSGRRVLR